jgi:hypothetical protein
MRPVAGDGTPSIGTVTDAGPLRYVASVRRTGNTAPRLKVLQRESGSTSVGRVKL